MAEERIVTTEPASAHTTIIREEAPRSGSGAGWLIAIVLLIAVIGGFYLFNRTTASDAAKNNAIANAADNIGSAANKVGDAAQNAADSATK